MKTVALCLGSGSWKTRSLKRAPRWAARSCLMHCWENAAGLPASGGGAADSLCLCCQSCRRRGLLHLSCLGNDSGANPSEEEDGDAARRVALCPPGVARSRARAAADLPVGPEWPRATPLSASAQGRPSKAGSRGPFHINGLARPWLKTRSNFKNIFRLSNRISGARHRRLRPRGRLGRWGGLRPRGRLPP